MACGFSLIPPTTRQHMCMGKYAETEVLVELTNNEIRIASRKDAIRPPNAKRSDVKKIMQAAAMHGEELVALWEQVHGRV
jgi:hypothetical protein